MNYLSKLIVLLIWGVRVLNGVRPATPFIIYQGMYSMVQVPSNDHFNHLSISSSISCKDENNKEVDWFYIYKLPKNKFSQNPLIKAGLAYMYVTPDTLKNGWKLSEKSINDTGSIPELTLRDLTYSNDQMFLIYNDQPPVNSRIPKKSKKKVKFAHGGHTKGIVLADKDSGFWLIHSVPKFPERVPSNTDNERLYSYPLTATVYGQSFLCMSVESKMMDTIGVQLSYNEPRIIASHVPETLQKQFSKIVDVVNNKTVSSSPWARVTKFNTKDGTVFKSFAKSANFKDDLYSGLIAQYLKSDLLTETWINGPNVLKSNCSFKYKVNNIIKIGFSDKNVAFSSHKDHSKWAVSVPQNHRNYQSSTDDDYWVCVGDINRAHKQEERGGGSVCIENKDIWKLYSNAINDIEPCST